MRSTGSKKAMRYARYASFFGGWFKHSYLLLRLLPHDGLGPEVSCRADLRQHIVFPEMERPFSPADELRSTSGDLH